MRYLFFLLLSGMFACDPHREEMNRVSGWAPVYASAQTTNAIGAETTRATIHPGKIYAYGQYLFQVEQNEGIHIIDNTDAAHPRKLSFLKVPSCAEIAIKANHLYTNNLNDLVVFDLSTIAAPRLVQRIEGAFPEFNQTYPPVAHGYFECPDPSKGIVVGWEQKLLTDAKCRR